MTKKVEYLEIRVRQLQETINVSNAAKAGLMRERDQALAREVKLRAALTPSAETKAAYIGEFRFSIAVDRWDDDEDYFEGAQEVTVPWTTIKEIMAAICARAALKEGQPHD